MTNFNRLTRRKDDWPCRMNICTAEDWIEEITGTSEYNWSNSDFCSSCPFMQYINRLAELEDEKERMEDDRK